MNLCRVSLPCRLCVVLHVFFEVMSFLMLLVDSMMFGPLLLTVDDPRLDSSVTYICDHITRR